MIGLLEFVVLLALAMVVWIVAACVLSIGTGIAILVRKAYESDRSMWFHAGCASVYLRLLVRSPSTGITAIAVTLMAIQVADVVETFAEEAASSEFRSSTNPPPEVPPVLESTLQMPTEYPFERTRTPWPPFLGHKFPLGRC